MCPERPVSILHLLFSCLLSHLLAICRKVLLSALKLVSRRLSVLVNRFKERLSGFATVDGEFLVIFDEQPFLYLIPDLLTEHETELFDFLSQKGYKMAWTSGEQIRFGCELQDAMNGKRSDKISPDLAISMEDILSQSTSLFDAGTRLREAIRRQRPTKSIDVVDAYIFPKKHDSDYFDFFFEVFSSCFRQVKEIRIFTKRDHNKALAKKIKDRVRSELGKNINIIHTSDFHDRFWVVDDARGVYIGTSLSGVGRKYTLFSDLSTEDARDIVEALSKIRER